MTVNEKIAELLDWSGMTQQELADKIGVTRANVSAYVTGRASVSLEQAYKIAAALEVTPWTLLNGEPLPVSPQELSEAEQRMIADLRGLKPWQLEFIERNVAMFIEHNRE